MEMIESDYQKKCEEEFVNYLLTVKDYSKEAMKEFKTSLVKNYRKDFFPNILAKNGTLSAEKIHEICRMYHLIFKTSEDAATRRILYSIERETK